MSPIFNVPKFYADLRNVLFVGFPIVVLQLAATYGRLHATRFVPTCTGHCFATSRNALTGSSIPHNGWVRVLWIGCHWICTEQW